MATMANRSMTLVICGTHQGKFLGEQGELLGAGLNNIVCFTTLQSGAYSDWGRPDSEHVAL